MFLSIMNQFVHCVVWKSQEKWYKKKKWKRRKKIWSNGIKDRDNTIQTNVDHPLNISDIQCYWNDINVDGKFPFQTVAHLMSYFEIFNRCDVAIDVYTLLTLLSKHETIYVSTQVSVNSLATKYLQCFNLKVHESTMKNKGVWNNVKSIYID